MTKSCTICGSTAEECELLLDAPCSRHHVCSDCIPSFFENATKNESLFPPQCCTQIFMLEDYEEYVPFEVAWGYQVKQAGEYSVLAKFRIYCANPACATFLHPSTHITDPSTNLPYAPCTAPNCGVLTCTNCRTRLTYGTANHVCAQNEDEAIFKQTAREKGYQECFVCGATVELAEACNHITCECGNDFCYICGVSWEGPHACPQYGPPVYDEEGYNQDGFHRNTGLNREGLTRRQMADEEDEEEEDDGENDDHEGEDPEWEVLQHLTPAQRAMVDGLPREQREDALDQFRITLFEEQGITFNQEFGARAARQRVVEDDEDEDPEDEEDEEEENQEETDYDEGQDEPTPTLDILIRPTPTEAAVIQNLNRIYDSAEALFSPRVDELAPMIDEPDLHVALTALMREAANLIDPDYDTNVSVTALEHRRFVRMLIIRRMDREEGVSADPVWGADRITLLARVQELSETLSAVVNAEHNGNGNGDGAATVGEADAPAPSPSNEANTRPSSPNASPAPAERATEDFPLPPLFRGPSGGPGAWVDDDL